MSTEHGSKLYYTCEICNEKVNCRYMKHHLRDKPNLTSQEYYHKYIIKDEIIPKCIHCGNDIPFCKLSRPYGKFCSHHCKSSYNMTRLNYNQEFQKLANDGQRYSIANTPGLLNKKIKIGITNYLKYAKKYTIKRFNKYPPKA